MTVDERKPLFKVHKEDVRKKFRESSDVLERERLKGAIKKKKPYRVISGKEKGQSPLMQSMRGQYLLGKLGAKISSELDMTHISKPDMFSACRLSYDGMRHNRTTLKNRLIGVTEAKKPTLLAYKNLLTPLGNFIIGQKIVDKYCKGVLSKEEINKADGYYMNMKQHILAIDPIMVDEKRIYNYTLRSLRRKHGVEPMPKQHMAAVLYNVDGRGIRYHDLFDVDQLIAEYEATHWGKNAIWQGAKTKAFQDWMEKLG